jgi:hypothetical protein
VENSVWQTSICQTKETNVPPNFAFLGKFGGTFQEKTLPLQNH